MNLEDVTLALAGIFQAAELVHQVARHSMVDADPYQASITSILKLDADNVKDVYGGAAGVRRGLKMLAGNMNLHHDQNQREVLRYVIELMSLERSLHKRPEMLAQIGEGVREAVAQSEYFSPTHPNVVAKLADIYLNTISTFKHRIYVKGEPRYLQDSDNANRIRALLLAGIRSAHLWRQKRGGRLQLLLRRRAIARTAERLLKT